MSTFMVSISSSPMTVKEMSNKLVFSSITENLTLAEQLVDKVCDDFNIHEDYYGNILVAVTEAVTNAIEHGNAGDPNKNVDLTYSMGEKELRFLISDQGDGFDFNDLPDPTNPENIEKPNGRGIFLMKHLADEIEFKENGKTIELVFQLPQN